MAMRSAPGLRVHTPFGPRKSGMPASVEMPAPVSTDDRSGAGDVRRTARKASCDRQIRWPSPPGSRRRAGSVARRGAKSDRVCRRRPHRHHHPEAPAPTERLDGAHELRVPRCTRRGRRRRGCAGDRGDGSGEGLLLRVPTAKRSPVTSSGASTPTACRTTRRRPDTECGRSSTPTSPTTSASRNPSSRCVNGPAAGLGFALMCYCDVRFAAAGAKLTSAHGQASACRRSSASRGCCPASSGSRRAADVLLSSRVFLAEEALAMGLVNAVVPAGKLAAHVSSMHASSRAKCLRRSIAVTKRQLYRDLLGCRRPGGRRSPMPRRR